MIKLFIFVLIFFCIQSFGQETPTDMAKPIVAEGKRLYRSEMASWYGTDLFLASFKDQASIGGYFSYQDIEKSKCVFFSKDSSPLVIGTISFDSSYSTTTAEDNLTRRPFTELENNYYTIRTAALKLINTDTLFKTYKNTTLNLIPLVAGAERKVYALTGPSQSGVVIFGNDYLMRFDQNNQLLEKKQLHRNIIPINYTGKEEEAKDIEATMHSHAPETGEFITATDICTLMLYEKFAKWKQHNVVSKTYLNLWNCLTDELVVVTMDTLRKINKD